MYTDVERVRTISIEGVSGVLKSGDYFQGDDDEVEGSGRRDPVDHGGEELGRGTAGAVPGDESAVARRDP